MDRFHLNQTLSFDKADGHPDSVVAGIDHYTFEAKDGMTRHWLSYTLVPVQAEEAKGVYARWYVVDFPDVGLTFVEIVDEDDLPENLSENAQLTGNASIQSEGDAEMGTGKALLQTFNAGEGVMYARETFGQDNSVMFFRNSRLKGPVAAVS
jgi:hypothetical protein